MRIEDEVFRKAAPDLARLAEYGFREDADGALHGAFPFLNGEFRAELTVRPDGTVAGKVAETATGDEYLLLRVESAAGSFVGKVRQAYRELLEELREHCFAPEPFRGEQTNRLTRQIAARWGEGPDHPFADLPEFGVFRYPANRKWYALVMNIRKSLLTGERTGREGPMAEVLNLKIDPSRFAELTARPGIYPAYHMKRPNWISILLDESVADDLLMDLIASSRDFAVRNGKRSGKKRAAV